MSTEEIFKDLAKEESASRTSAGCAETIHAMQSLQAHQGWMALMRIAEGQRELRQQELMKPRAQQDHAEGEFLKGELMGIDLFMRLPQVLQAQAQEMMKLHLARASEEDDTSEMEEAVNG